MPAQQTRGSALTLPCRPDGLPPSPGGKYVGFGSAPPPQAGQGAGSSQVRKDAGARACGSSALTLVCAAAGRPVEHGVHGHQPTHGGGEQRRERHGGHREARVAGACEAAWLRRGLHAPQAAHAAAPPHAQEVSQRYQRGELAESASTLLATGADLGIKGLTNLKGLLKTAVSQIDSYAGPALAGDGCVCGWRQRGQRA